MMRLLFITNKVEIGRIAQAAGIDWIFVDLEYRGKAERQAQRNTVISCHTIDDVKRMRHILTKSKLMVRINPLGAWSEDEINQVVSTEADIIMLPYFHTAIEIKKFVELVNCRCKTCILVETMSAISNLDEILDVSGIDFIHIGLNDLHIERGTRFMFEFLGDGSMDEVAYKIRQRKIPFGFGGMARIGDKIPPGERILAEHYRLGSTGVILSRTFCDLTKFTSLEELEHFLIENVKAIRDVEKFLTTADTDFFEYNRLIVKEQIKQVVKSLNSTPQVS